MRSQAGSGMARALWGDSAAGVCARPASVPTRWVTRGRSSTSLNSFPHASSYSGFEIKEGICRNSQRRSEYTSPRELYKDRAMPH